MIREYTPKDIDSIMEIWLASAVSAHRFIPEAYWNGNYALVRDTCLPASKTFVYEEDGQTRGFISILNDSHIGALFVETESQGKGIGGALLQFAKERYGYLSLAVYAENQKAVRFYRRAGFSIDSDQTNEDSGAWEYCMSWRK